MDRRFALVALWALFAAAAVGVGFGAAGLVGDPFGDGVISEPPAVSGSVAAGSRTPGAGTPSGSPSGSPSSSESPGKDPTTSPGRSDTPSSQQSTSRPTRPATAQPTPVTRSLSTRAGLVSATCRGGGVQVAASPAVGWEIEDLDGGGSSGGVRFERADDSDGRVEVRVGCVAGRPRFSLDDRADGDGNGGDEPTSDESPGDGHLDDGNGGD